MYSYLVTLPISPFRLFTKKMFKYGSAYMLFESDGKGVASPLFRSLLTDPTYCI